MAQNIANIAQLIKAIGLKPIMHMIHTPGGQQHCMTSIVHLLTEDSPTGHFHFNQSDIVHYYHLGDPIQYTLIFPDGTLQTIVMGQNVLAGQCVQLHMPGGIWKASQLMQGAAGFGVLRSN